MNGRFHLGVSVAYVLEKQKIRFFLNKSGVAEFVVAKPRYEARPATKDKWTKELIREDFIRPSPI